MPSLNWRYVYLVAIGLRFVFGTGNSYIHPDEHFQSFEVMTSILGFSTSPPWEFTSDAPVRSYGPLYLIYGPLLWWLKALNMQLKPITIWYLVRLQLIVINWVVSDMCLYRLLPTKQERVKATFFTATSYITLVHQSHCFSNSVETPLVLICLLFISNWRRELEANSIQPSVVKPFLFGALVALGIFNRVTFLAFLLVPSYHLVRYIFKNRSAILPIALGFAGASIAFIVVDTVSFNRWNDVESSPWVLANYVITPWNNLRYNSNVENLALHGIHSRFTHILAGIPQILGPGLFLLFHPFNGYWRTTPFLAFVSGLAILSIVPHQEVRFLLPLVPIACCCFDLNSLTPDVKKPSRIAKHLITSWYVFNLALAVLMGVYHQGGVVPVIDYSYDQVKADKPFVHIWWRTYTPPTWLYGDTTNNTAMMSVKDYLPEPIAKRTIIDAMGSSQEIVDSLLTDFANCGTDVYFIAPTASMNCGFNSTHNLSLVWRYQYHIDLDHLDFSSKRCLQPGIDVYKLI